MSPDNFGTTGTPSALCVLCEADELGQRELEQVRARGYPSAANTSEVMRRVLCMLEAVEDELCLLEVSELLEVFGSDGGDGGAGGDALYPFTCPAFRRRHVICAYTA